MLTEMTNGTCVKYSMEPQAYKVVITHAHEIPVWKNIPRLFHEHATNLGGMNVDVHYELSTLEFNNGEQLEYLHSRILMLQQKLSSLEKMYLLQYLSSSTLRNFQRAIN